MRQRWLGGDVDGTDRIIGDEAGPSAGRSTAGWRYTLPVLMGAIVLLAGCAQGEYRMPYGDGTVVDIVNDHVTHSSPKAYMYDIRAQGAAGAAIVAAAPGWIRFIDDSHEEPTSENNYVWIEHPYPFCPVDAGRAHWPGKPSNYASTCIPCDRDFCNEWTTYAHMTRDSVRVDAGLSEGDWVEAGAFLGYEDDVGAASNEHLHWHVAVIPPDTVPTYNGYYQAYVDAGHQPEVIPIVCHQSGRSVLWRFGIYTAAACPAPAPWPAKSFFLAQPEARSPLAAALQRLASITDEGIWIALDDPRLMLRTRRLLARLDPDVRDLIHLGRARVSAAELEMVMELLVAYEQRGSGELRRALQPIREQLSSATGRQSLGITVEDRSEGLD
jgi:murein DD-endopeptidase MepM/ murein hydrolase activator NlpD